jgi:hypothetical protein
MLFSDFVEQTRLNPQVEQPLLLFYNFNLIDGSGSPASPHSALLMRGTQIEQVWPGNATGPNPAALLEKIEPALIQGQPPLQLDLAEATLMPGLVDMHVHLRRDEWALPLYLAQGITTVRDCANNLYVLQYLEQALQEGRLQGPRLFYSGPLFDGADLTWPPFMCKRVESPAQVESRMSGLDQHPVDFIKLYTGLGLPESQRLIGRSHELGYYTAAHLGGGNTAALINSGLDGVEHIFSFSRQLDPTRFNKLSPRDDNGLFFQAVATVWDEVGRGALPDTELLRLFELMLERGTYLTPTLAFNYVAAHQDQPFIQQDPLLAAVDPTLKTFWAKRSLTDGWQPHDFETARHSIKVMGQYAVRFWEMGGQLLIGSDTPNAYMIPGRSLHYELETLVAAGLPPLTAIHLATQGAATWLGRSHRHNRAQAFGTIAAGYIADLIVLEQDPSQDITNCRTIRYVIQNGRCYEPSQLIPTLADKEKAHAAV